MHYRTVLALLILVEHESRAEVDKRYASLPDLFHMDNYDKCMLLGDEAFYCNIKYILEPVNKTNVSQIWRDIQNISSIKTNYRHDHIRHYICVPKTCPEVTTFNENDPLLKKQLEDCYNKKFEQFELRGEITEINCETQNPKYPIDWLDIICGVLFILYLFFVLCATCYETVARDKTPEEYKKITETPTGKIISCFSITKNWNRLKTINSTPEIEKFRVIQGIRFINSAMVVFSHTIMGFAAVPALNTRWFETMHEQVASILFGSGHISLTTFFFISDFLLSKDLFKYMKDKKGLSIKMVLQIFVARICRLLPSMALIILFHATWLRHIGNGPVWNNILGHEARKCRKNWWTNFLFINTLVDQDNMCVATTWYMALSTQYFMLSLLFIWMIKKYEKYVYYLIGAAISLQITATFFQSYYHNLTCLVLLPAEVYFGINGFIESDQFKYHVTGFIPHLAGPILGIAFGYYFNKHQSEKPQSKLLNIKFPSLLFWLAFCTAWSCIIVPGLLIFLYSNKHNTFWASTYLALSRTIWNICLGICLFGFFDGLGGIARRVFEFPPLYILGRLTYSLYLVHMSIVLITASLSRQLLYSSNIVIVNRFFGDLVAVYIGATILTLLVELPVSALMKMVFVLKDKGKEEKEEKDNILKNE